MWNYLERLGIIWNYLESFGIIWNHLECIYDTVFDTGHHIFDTAFPYLSLIYIIKEKAKKETEEKPLSLVVDGRREIFHQECLKRIGQYDNQQLADFYNYWSQENPDTGKMRFEEQRYWNLDSRLKRWIKNQYATANTAAAIRMKRLEKKEKQQAIAQTRQEDNERVWQEIEERKKGAVSHEEWLAMKSGQQAGFALNDK